MNLIILYQKYKNLMGLDPQEPRPRGGQHDLEAQCRGLRGDLVRIQSSLDFYHLNLVTRELKLGLDNFTFPSTSRSITGIL